MSSRVEEVILSNLLANDDYCRKALPFLDEEFFSDKIEKIVFNDIKKFFNEYTKMPTQQILKIGMDDRKDLKQGEYDHAIKLIESLGEAEKNIQWLFERTEKFCKDQALYNAIMESISILDGKNNKFNKEAIPSILQEALAVSFDKTIGHDFFDDADRRYDFYHLKEERIAFGLDMFNKITKGGLPKKTLNVVLAGTNVGKSLFLCSHAADVLRMGKNVLYITLEMAEERIAERIDCNLMDITLDELYHMKKSDFTSRMQEVHAKAQGKLVIKEYPTSAAHAGHFKALLEELKLKKGFIPDLICIDYINICCSQRLKGNASANSYTIIKSIAEELRGLAVEYDVPILSATQTNRTGWQNTDVEMSDTSESAGLPMTVDFLFAMMRTEELDEMGQIMIKQLKSRYNDVNYYKRFVVGVDITKFKLHDVDQPTKDLSDTGREDKDDGPVFDKSKFGSRMRGSKVDFDTGEINFD